MPDDAVEIQDGSSLLGYQGNIGANILDILDFSRGGVDPKDDSYFVYYLSADKSDFQLMAFLEEEQNVPTVFFPQAYAEKDYSNLYPVVFGEKLGILLDETTKTPVHEIEAVKTAGALDLDGSTESYTAYFKNDDTATDTGENLWETIEEEREEGTSSSSVSSSSTTASTAPTDWRDQDPNCDRADVTIWTQTWAWCNSTLGTWFEFWQKDADIGTNNYSGSVGSCYNYNGNNSATCIKWDITMASTSKANDWFTGTNNDGDTAVDNIWGKFYTWDSLDTDNDDDIDANDTNLVCWVWYHVPSELEWETLEEYLNGSACRTTSNWQCDWQWWQYHSTTNSDSSIAALLQIPLSGWRSNNTFNSRGYYGYLWSSTVNGSEAYRRGFSNLYTTVDSNNRTQSNWYSVRCIKD